MIKIVYLQQGQTTCEIKRKAMNLAGFPPSASETRHRRFLNVRAAEEKGNPAFLSKYSLAQNGQSQKKQILPTDTPPLHLDDVSLLGALADRPPLEGDNRGPSN